MMTNNDILTQRNSLYALVEELRDLSGDLRATSLINQATHNGIDNENIVVRSDNFFQRPYTNDINNASLIEDDWYRSFVEIQMSRPGMYDLLPEGIFFQPLPKDYERNRELNIAELVLKYRKDKQKEKEIRRFFQPIENEFFRYETFIEQQESFLIASFQKPIIEIWNFDQSISERDQISLALLIPYALEINGNISLMTKTLSILLNEPVKIVRQSTPKSQYADPLQLGQFVLGNTMICGASFWEESVTLQYQIGPLNNYHIEDFIENGKGVKLVETFNQYFIPLEASVEIEIIIDPAQQKTTLSMEDASILGYSTIL